MEREGIVVGVGLTAAIFKILYLAFETGIGGCRATEEEAVVNGLIGVAIVGEANTEHDLHLVFGLGSYGLADLGDIASEPIGDVVEAGKGFLQFGFGLKSGRTEGCGRRDIEEGNKEGGDGLLAGIGLAIGGGDRGRAVGILRDLVGGKLFGGDPCSAAIFVDDLMFEGLGADTGCVDEGEGEACLKRDGRAVLVFEDDLILELRINLEKEVDTDLAELVAGVGIVVGGNIDGFLLYLMTIEFGKFLTGGVDTTDENGCDAFVAAEGGSFSGNGAFGKCHNEMILK